MCGQGFQAQNGGADLRHEAAIMSELQKGGKPWHWFPQLLDVEERRVPFPHMVMDYAGQSLQAALQRGPMPHNTVLAAALQLQSALKAIHGLGVIHLDLKPANILWCGDLGQLKLADFGMSERASPRPSEIRFSVYVTAPCRPPELWDVPAEDLPNLIRPAVDFWSFGCVLYEMVTGRRMITAQRGNEMRTEKACVQAWCACWDGLRAKAPCNGRASVRQASCFDARLMAVGGWRASVLLAMCPKPAGRAVKLLAE